MCAMAVQSSLPAAVQVQNLDLQIEDQKNTLPTPMAGTPEEASGLIAGWQMDASELPQPRVRDAQLQGGFHLDELILGPRANHDQQNEIVSRVEDSTDTPVQRRRGLPAEGGFEVDVPSARYNPQKSRGNEAAMERTLDLNVAAGRSSSPEHARYDEATDPIVGLQPEPAPDLGPALVPDVMPDLKTLEQDTKAPLRASFFNTDGIWRHTQEFTANPQNADLLRGDPPAWTLANAIKKYKEATGGDAPQTRVAPATLGRIEELDDYAGIKSVFSFCWTMLLPIGTTLLCPPLTPAVALLQYAFSSPQDQISTCLVSAAGALLGLPAASPNPLADFVLEWGAGESAKHLVFHEKGKPAPPEDAPMPAVSEPARAPHTAVGTSVAPAPHQTLEEFILSCERIAQRYA